MPDEVTSEAPVVANATPVVAPARAPELGARSPESLVEKMEKLGWDKDAPHTQNPKALGSLAREAEKAEGAEPAKEEAKVEPAKEPEKPKAKADPSDKRAQLDALAKELGMSVEGDRVSVAERAALREERRVARETLAKAERDAMGRVEAAAKALEEREAKAAPSREKLTALEKAVADDDHEALAKLMGHESYDKWQEHIIGVKSDPNYKTIKALQAQIEADKREKETAAETAKRQAEETAAREAQQGQQRAQAEAQRAYMADLSKEMSQSTDPLVKAMHDDPSFVAAVFRVQQEHWDGQKTISVEQAIRTAAKGAPAPLMAELKKLHDRLAPIFRSPTESDGVAAAAARPKVTTKEVKKPRTPDAVTPPAPSRIKMDDKEWKRKAAIQLEQAAREDKARGVSM